MGVALGFVYVVRVIDAATAEATRSLRDREVRRGAAPFWYSELGGTGLLVSRLGFGTFRVVSQAENHRSALALALERGVNLIDTSPTFGGGDAELAVGDVVEGLGVRGSTVVMTRVGYVTPGLKGPEAITSFDLGRGVRYSLDPRSIARELRASRDRLRMRTLDVALIQTPESVLESKASPGAASMAQVFARAFETLEGEVAAGRLQHYGVVSNAFGRNGGILSIEGLLDAARRVAGDRHHLALVQLPVNLVERGMLDGVVASARKAGLGVVANRPLNAMTDKGMLRLADLPTPLGPPLSRAPRTARQLELELDSGIARAMRSTGSGTCPTVALADELARRAEEYREPVRFSEWVEVRFTPELSEAVQRFEGRLAQPMKAAFRFWLERYVTALTGLTSALHARCVQEASGRVTALSELARPLFGAVGPSLSSAQVALLSVAGLEDVTSVLVGMRDPAYVREAVELFGLERPRLTSAALITALSPSTEVSGGKSTLRGQGSAVA